MRPIKLNDLAALKAFERFIQATTTNFPITSAICDKAAEIRAAHGFKALDALHLATAVVHGCHTFLTNDLRLAGFSDVKIEELS